MSAILTVMTFLLFISSFEEKRKEEKENGMVKEPDVKKREPSKNIEKQYHTTTEQEGEGIHPVFSNENREHHVLKNGVAIDKYSFSFEVEYK